MCIKMDISVYLLSEYLTGARCMIMFNHQIKLQARRYLDPDFQVILSRKFKALSLMADVETLQGARHLTQSARAFSVDQIS